MATKSLTIFIDQFSDRIFDLGFDNVHLYDFGYLHETTWINSPYDEAGYNTYDDWYFNYTDTEDTLRTKNMVLFLSHGQFSSYILPSQ